MLVYAYPTRIDTPYAMSSHPRTAYRQGDWGPPPTPWGRPDRKHWSPTLSVLKVNQLEAHEIEIVPTENSVCPSPVSPQGACNNVGFFAAQSAKKPTMLPACLRKPPPVNFDLDAADSQAPSER